VASLGLRSGRDRTCPMDLVHDLPLASFSAELMAGWNAGPVSDPTNCPGQTRTVAHRLGTKGTLIPCYRQWSSAPLHVVQRPVAGNKG
jgi:hypothetical protein